MMVVVVVVVVVVVPTKESLSRGRVHIVCMRCLRPPKTKERKKSDSMVTGKRKGLKKERIARRRLFISRYIISRMLLNTKFAQNQVIPQLSSPNKLGRSKAQFFTPLRKTVNRSRYSVPCQAFKSTSGSSIDFEVGSNRTFPMRPFFFLSQNGQNPTLFTRDGV